MFIEPVDKHDDDKKNIYIYIAALIKAKQSGVVSEVKGYVS